MIVVKSCDKSMHLCQPVAAVSRSLPCWVTTLAQNIGLGYVLLYDYVTSGKVHSNRTIYYTGRFEGVKEKLLARLAFQVRFSGCRKGISMFSYIDSYLADCFGRVRNAESFLFPFVSCWPLENVLPIQRKDTAGERAR